MIMIIWSWFKVLFQTEFLYTEYLVFEEVYFRNYFISAIEKYV